MIEGAPPVGPHYLVCVTIVLLAGLALAVLVDVISTSARPAPLPPPDRITVDLRRRP